MSPQLVILRQLVDWQLTHCARIKDMLDLAWGVKAAKHQKKVDKDANAPPPPDHPESRQSLTLEPYGQDSARKRYWVLDGELRIVFVMPAIHTERLTPLLTVF